MLTEILYQILLAVGIVAGIFLIINLWRFSDILKRVQETSKVIEARIAELDTQIAQVQLSVNNLPGLIKNFLLSFEVVKMIVERLNKKSDKKEGE